MLPTAYYLPQARIAGAPATSVMHMQWDPPFDYGVQIATYELLINNATTQANTWPRSYVVDSRWVHYKK